MTDKNSEWIDANDALKLAEKVLNGRGEAKKAIAECLRDGELRSMASKRWKSKSYRIKDAWSIDNRPNEIIEDSEIPTDVFRSSVKWSLDQDDWRWPHNRFSICHQGKTNWRHMLLGVKLHRGDLQKKVLKGKSSNAGSPGKPEQWMAFWFALVDLEREGLLDQVTFPTQSSLRSEVLARMNEGLCEKTITPTISQVWKKFVEGHLPRAMD